MTYIFSLSLLFSQTRILHSHGVVSRKRTLASVGKHKYKLLRGRFHSISLEFMRSGHSHNEMDQRFSSVGATLAAAPVLQDEREFANWVTANLKPIGNRQIHVEVLPGTWDFNARCA